MEKILVLDFGGQYNQLIARRVRDHHIYAEILPYTTPLSVIRENGYKGIIFTGGRIPFMTKLRRITKKAFWSLACRCSAFATAAS